MRNLAHQTPEFFDLWPLNFSRTVVPSAPVMRSTASFKLNPQPGAVDETITSLF